MNKQTEIIDCVRRFAQQCNYEKQHSEQVAWLAQRLFDQLEPIHHIGADQKWLLTAAGLLHDIGWVHGQKEHHKASMEMILSDTTMPLKPQDRHAIALTARYHRRAFPNESHLIYGRLPARQQQMIAVLGGILRIADGLDHSHANAVQRLEVEICPDLINILCFGGPTVGDESPWGQKKADLLEHSLGMKVRVICHCDQVCI
jgi:exopolyphosphatase/pppGpp-phosphohydrolase